MPVWPHRQPLVLASQSTARRGILRDAGIPITVRPARIDERAVERQAGVKSARAAAKLLARAKAQAVSRKMPGRLVLGADQTLALGARRFSKPKSRGEARRQLRALSGRTHTLYSALALVCDGRVLFEYDEAARLRMRKLSSAFLTRYLAAAGRAATQSVGGYQLEGAGAHLFSAVDGDYFTVLGLPLLPLLAFLRRKRLIAG